MDGAHLPVQPDWIAPPGGTFQNQDHLVVGKCSSHQPFLESTGSSWSITPPTIRATAHDVCAIDNEYLHPDSVGESAGIGMHESAFTIGASGPQVDTFVLPAPPNGCGKNGSDRSR